MSSKTKIVVLHMKEIMYAKIKGLDHEGKEEAFRIAQVFNVNNGSVKVADIGEESVLLECTLTDHRNDDLIALLKKQFKGKVEIVRGGAVAVEAISTSCR